MSLLQWVRRRRDRTQLDRLAVATQLTSALEALHAGGTLHLDIRPQNVFVRRGSCQLADFGVVSLTENWLGETGRIFRAPELYDSEPSSAADVFSLAAVLAFLVAEGSEATTPYDWLHDAPGNWRECLEVALHPDPNRRPSPAELRDHFTQMSPEQSLSMREFDELLASPEFAAVLSRRVASKTKGSGAAPEQVEDAVQAVLLRLLSASHESLSFSSKFTNENAVVAYAVKSVERETWRSLRAYRRSEPLGAIDIAYGSMRHIAMPASATLETLADLEERLGKTPSRICRLRMHGRDLDQIASLVSSDAEAWKSEDVFLTLVRLERAYPELRYVLQRPDPAEARRLYEAWLRSTGHRSSIPLLAMRLAGYRLSEIAAEFATTESSISSRLFRLRQMDPSIALLLDPATAWPDEADKARRLLSIADDSELRGLDEYWRGWLRERAQVIFEEANQSEAPTRAAEAATRILDEFRIATEIRARVVSEPSVTVAAARIGALAETSDDTRNGVDTSAVIRFDDSSHGRMPAFQFASDGTIIPVVEAVNQVLRATEDPYGAFYWWIEPNSRLGERAPVELLNSRDKDYELVLMSLVQATLDLD
jgi:hypothetical protein